MPEQVEWTRRAVIKFAWTGVIAASVLSIEPLVEYLTSKEDRLHSPLVFYDKLLQENDWQRVPDSRVWVKKDDQGINALLATCTHLGCEVTYLPEKKEWHCPCHGSIYDTEGRPTSGPALKPLPRVAVERKADGSLVINTAKTVGLDVRG
jgi:cytochrome b6-f complex iron-sulfur subunit